MGEFDGIEPRITWEISFAEDGETTNLQRVNVNDYRLTDPQKALVFCAIIRYLAQFGYVKDDSAISRIPNQNFGPEPTLAMHIRHVQSVKEHMEKVDGKIAASHRNAIVARRESVGYARVSEGYDRFVSARRA
jgi:hypothetical protein